MLTTNELERIKDKLEHCRCQDCQREAEIIEKILEEVEQEPTAAVQIGIFKSPKIIEET